MASLNGHSEDESRSYKRAGSAGGDQASLLCEQNTTTNNATLDTKVTRQRPPDKWKLTGLAKDTPSHNGHPNHSTHFDPPDHTTPPDLPPRMHRRISDDTHNRREKPPALPPRNASDSKANYKDPSASGFVNSRKGGFSGTPNKWYHEREKVSRTGRFACVPPTLQEKWGSGLETVSLLQFVEKYSDSLPVQVSVEKGHYGSNYTETLGNQENLIISFVKSRKVLNIVTSTKQKFTLPLGSAVQLSFLYNPEGNEERARKGYKFPSIGEMMKKVPGSQLPKVICATKAYNGDGLKSTVHENEVLIVESYDMQTKRLQVISHSRNPIRKFLPDRCEGQFTTEPSKVWLYVSDINSYIGTPLSILELKAVLDTTELAAMSADTQIEKSLNDVVTLSGFVTERSLIGTRIEEELIPSTQPKAFEIPVTDNLCNVEVTVMQTHMAIKHPPSMTLDSQLESLYQEESIALTKTQRLFNDYVRHGHERDGVAINAPYNVYDEVHEPPPEIPPRITLASPYSTRDLLNPPKDDSDEVDSGTSTKDPDEHSSLSGSPADDTSDHHMRASGDTVGVTKSELETTIRSLLCEVMGEKQRVQPDRYSCYYMSMDSKEDGADAVGKVKLSDVILELSEVENLWYILGILLGIQKAKLDQIQANYGSGACPQGRCLIETICQWQDNHENATWSSIVQALYSMQKKQLAKRVAAKHKVMLPDPRKFPQDQFTKQLKEFIPEDRLSEISSRQQQMQEQDQRLSEVQERLGEYEQRMEENHKNLMAIKDHLQFNERFTRMLTRENQVLRMKQAYKEQLFKSPSQEGKSKDGQTSQEKLRKEIHTLHQAQESQESRLHVAHHDTMELKRQLFLIEGQMEITKKHLHYLQEQKHELTKGLREQECELSHIITGSLDNDGKEDGLPQYYNIIRCDGKVEVKLHEEELTMLQQDLDRKSKEVGSLKKKLQQKHERMSQVESLLAKQDDELMYTYTNGAESVVLEKHQNDHLKTRLQMEKIDCQIQLTRALLQKKDIESKLDAVKLSLDVSEKICQRAQELYQKSTSSRRNSLALPASKVSNRSTSFSSTTSEDSDVFVNKSASVNHYPKAVSSINGGVVKLDTSSSELDAHQQSTEDQLISVKKPTITHSPTPNAESVIDEQERTSTAVAYMNTSSTKGRTKGSGRPRTSALPSGAQRNYCTSSGSSSGAHHRRRSTTHSQTQRSSYRAQVAS